MVPVSNPRSTLHALTPLGVGTAEVESLTSYFCRLAHSHGMTARNLGAWILTHFDQPVPADFKWSQRSFSSLSPETEEWAARLAELTGVGALDRLTLVPWRQLLPTQGLAPSSDRWCTCCLAEDRAAENPPHLRLAWDLAPVTACAHHEVQLVSACPHCQRTNVRNRAATVVPGYCTSCGGFLGNAQTTPAAPEALWVARQVGQMLAGNPAVAPDGVGALLEVVIEKMASGRVGTFAKKLGVSKSGVWHWVRKGGLPNIQAWLAISLHGGIGLDRLFAGDTEDWVLPVEPVQVVIPQLSSPRKGIKARALDWDAIRAQLREFLQAAQPISLGQACARVGVDYRHLYLRANVEARAIADRYMRFMASRRADREARLKEEVGGLLRERREAGYTGMSAREVWYQLEGDVKSVRYSYTHIRAAVAAND